MFSKLFGTKKPDNEEKQIDPSKGYDKTYSIYLKSQFGKMYCIDGLTAKSTIYDVKMRLELIAGVAYSKMILTDDKIARRLGVPVEEYSFPDEVLLKDLGIKDGEVLIWKKFHENYMKQITSDKIEEHQKNKGKWNFGQGFQNSNTIPNWAKKEENKIFSITLVKNKKEQKHTLLLENLTAETQISDIMKYIENDAEKRFVAHGLYKNTDRNITTFWQIRPNEQVIWENVYEYYVTNIDREIEQEQQLKLYEINYKSFEEASQIDEKQNAIYGIQSKVDINKLLKGDKDCLDLFDGCLAKRGWVLIEYPEEIQTIIQNVCENIFAKLKNKQNKKWESFHQFGYQEFKNYKQVLRVLTGDLLQYFAKKYPKALLKDIEMISNAMDKLSLDIINVTLEKVWRCESMTEFSKNASVSIVSGWNNNKKLKVGMIDFVKYLNQKVDQKKTNSRYKMFARGVNVESHTDPGLFSLSFLSTCQGLQLYDISTKQWVSVPIDCGVLWCGEAAPFLTNGRIKSGIHRVMLNKNGTPRYTAWYEACHDNQISRSVINDIAK